jgi:hypothetical protein
LFNETLGAIVQVKAFISQSRTLVGEQKNKNKNK